MYIFWSIMKLQWSLHDELWQKKVTVNVSGDNDMTIVETNRHNELASLFMVLWVKNLALILLEQIVLFEL